MLLDCQCNGSKKSSLMLVNSDMNTTNMSRIYADKNTCSLHQNKNVDMSFSKHLAKIPTICNITAIA